MHTLLIQHESQPVTTSHPTADARTLGLELFEDAGAYSARFHCRDYVGILVVSKHTTGTVQLGADNVRDAKAEALEHYRGFASLYNVQVR